MISACTVAIQGMDRYLDVLVDSLKTKCTLVDELVVVMSDAVYPEEFVEYSGHLTIRMIHYPIGDYSAALCGHAPDLHKAIDRATNNYILITDPDVFFLSDVDRTYHGISREYGLSYIGVSHFNLGSEHQSYGYFPTVINLYTHKANLPDATWMEDKLCVPTLMVEYNPSWQKTPGKYLMPGGLQDHWKEFPHPNGYFDAGCNLWLWCKQQNLDWLSFQLPERLDCFQRNSWQKEDLKYPLNYNTALYKSNLEIGEGKFGNQDLIYHRTGASRMPAEGYVQLYEKLFSRSVPKLNLVS